MERASLTWTMIKVKRAYDPPARGDGYRVLVDRLWPRGLKKESLALDAWLRELAPSDALRRWFGHEPARFSRFRQRYRHELESDERRELLDDLRKKAARGAVTLLYAAKDPEHNNAVVLAEELA